MLTEHDKQMLTCEEAATNPHDYVCGKNQLLYMGRNIVLKRPCILQ